MSETAISSAVEQHQDQFNEVGLEAGLKTPTMMQIDANNTIEKAFCLIIVFVITFITVIISFGFHSQIHINSTIIKISPEDTSVKGETILNSISPFNRFSFLQVGFRRTEVNLGINTKIHVSYQILAFDEKTNKNYTIIQSNDEIRDIVFRKNNIESDKITLFNDKKLISKEYKLFLSITGRILQTLSYLEINWGYGDHAITYIFIIIRSIYMLIISILFIMYTKLMYRIKFRLWTSEQKLTYFLIILCFFSDYPLSNIYIGKFTLIIMIFFIVLNSLFQTFLLYFVISIFRCLKGQFHSKYVFANRPIVSLFIALTIADIVFSIMNFIDLYNFKYLKDLNSFQSASTFCELSLTLFTIFIIIENSVSFDETEFQRFIAYSFHTFFMMIVTFPSKIIKNEIQFSYIASLIEATGYNLFVITMCYFHWTYTILESTSYQDSSMQEIKEGIIIDKINDNDDDTDDVDDDDDNSA